MQPQPTTAGPSPLPDPTPDRHAAAPSGISKIIGVVGALLLFAQSLAEAACRHAASGKNQLAEPLVRRFCTTDTVLITARITRALMRATALHALLLWRAARGRELRVPPVRAPAPRQPHQANPATPPAARRVRPEFLDPAYIPTEQEIAAEVRRRPVGAVLVDICRDLGILPGTASDPVDQDLFGAVCEYGGDIVALFRLPREAADPALWQEAGPDWPDAPAMPVLAAATGPP